MITFLCVCLSLFAIGTCCGIAPGAVLAVKARRPVVALFVFIAAVFIVFVLIGSAVMLP